MEVINDDGIEFMPECSVMCNLCNEHIDKALHLCFDEGPPDYRSACMNVCVPCLRSVLKRIPAGWTD